MSRPNLLSYQYCIHKIIEHEMRTKDYIYKDVPFFKVNYECHCLDFLDNMLINLPIDELVVKIADPEFAKRICELPIYQSLYKLIKMVYLCKLTNVMNYSGIVEEFSFSTNDDYLPIYQLISKKSLDDKLFQFDDKNCVKLPYTDISKNNLKTLIWVFNSKLFVLDKEQSNKSKLLLTTENKKISVILYYDRYNNIFENLSKLEQSEILISLLDYLFQNEFIKNISIVCLFYIFMKYQNVIVLQNLVNNLLTYANLNCDCDYNKSIIYEIMNHVWIEDLGKINNWSNSRLISRFIKTEISKVKNGNNRKKKFRNWIETTDSQLCKYIQNNLIV